MDRNNIKNNLTKFKACILYNFIFGAVFFIVYVTSILLINGFTYEASESEIRLGYIIASTYALFFFGGNIYIYFKKYKMDVSVIKYLAIILLSFICGSCLSFVLATMYR